MTPGRWHLQVRKEIEVCTDPQRRFYDGCWASSEMRWTEWDTLLTTHPRLSKEELEKTMNTFKKANDDGREYRVIWVEETA